MLAAFALLLATAPPVPDAAQASLIEQDRRVAGIGYRLASTGAELCGGNGRPSGLVLERLSLYGGSARDAASARGVAPEPTVVIVVSNSPAQAAGLLPGDRLLAIDGVSLPPDGSALDATYGPTLAARTAIEDALRDGTARLTIGRGENRREIDLHAPPGCRARFEVMPSVRRNAFSDGFLIQVTSRLARETVRDEWLAAVLAHELAHNVLGHAAQIATVGARSGAARANELLADRLSLYFMVAAGYDPAAAVAFRRAHPGDADRGRHPAGRDRVSAMEREAASIAALRLAGRPVLPPPGLLRPEP